jgi:esterase/lipase superfamily enzyme
MSRKRVYLLAIHSRDNPVLLHHLPQMAARLDGRLS